MQAKIRYQLRRLSLRAQSYVNCVVGVRNEDRTHLSDCVVTGAWLKVGKIVGCDVCCTLMAVMRSSLSHVIEDVRRGSFGWCGSLDGVV